MAFITHPGVAANKQAHYSAGVQRAYRLTPATAPVPPPPALANAWPRACGALTSRHADSRTSARVDHCIIADGFVAFIDEQVESRYVQLWNYTEAAIVSKLQIRTNCCEIVASAELLVHSVLLPRHTHGLGNSKKSMLLEASSHDDN